MTGSKFVWVSI